MGEGEEINMELKSLFCPNCGASLEVEDGIDTFFANIVGIKFCLMVRAMQHMKPKRE